MDNLPAILDADGRPMARQSDEPTYPDEARIPFAARTVAGVSMWPADKALQSSAFWAAWRYLSQTIGQLPGRVKRLTRSGEENVSAHPVDTLFNWRINPELSPFQFKETLTGWAILHGNGIAEIERDMVGRAVALWPIHPDRVEFVRDVETGELLYEIDSDTKAPVKLRGMDVFHVRGYGNGPVGLSVVEYAAQSLGWQRATEMFGAAFFGNGLNGGAVIEGAGSLKDGGMKRLDAQFRARHGGPARSHLPLYLDSGMKFVKTSANPDESQFIDTLQFQIEEMCRWVGVPPQKVHHLLRMTFNNVEQLAIEVVVDSIAPWAIRFEQEANYKLFGSNRTGLFLKLDLKGLLRGDFKGRQEGLQIMRRNGVISADDWAEIEDMKKPGTKVGGDKYIVEGNMTTLEKVGEDPPAPAQKPQPTADQPPASAATAQAIDRLVMEYAPELADAA